MILYIQEVCNVEFELIRSSGLGYVPVPLVNTVMKLRV